VEEQKYIEAQFDWIKNELVRLRQAVEKLSETTITEKSFERMVGRVDQLDEDCQIVTRRVDDVENDMTLVKRTGAFALGIAGAVLTAWVIMALGLR